MLPYSVTEIYGIRNSGKYETLRQIHNEMYRIYSQENIVEQLLPNTVVVEDSNAGFQFFESICRRSGSECIAAGGKSKILSLLCNMGESNVLVIADGAAFGCEMEKVAFTEFRYRQAKGFKEHIGKYSRLCGKRKL